MRWFGRSTSPERPPAQAVKTEAVRVLPGIYVGRVLVATVVFVAAAFYFRAVPPEVLLLLAVGAIASLLMSGGSAFWTHVARRSPGATFMYLQALFDLVLVTMVVHVTGGADSDFASLYIAVIAYAAVLLPLKSSLLVTIFGSSTYVADIIWGHPTQLTLAVWLQIGVFLTVAVATGWLASRVRVVGREREVLQREVKRLRLEAGDILRNIGSGVVTVDGDGSLVYANPAAEALLDFRASEWAGRPVLSFLDARSHELAAAISRTQQTGVRIFRAEGSVLAGALARPIGMTTTALHVEGQETPSVTAIFTDISDQKRLDELNLRTERLEAVAELSASLAHEIKNPLASIRSSVEQLARMGPDAGDDERFLGQLVIRESDRLSRLLNEFLDFARVRVAMSRPVDLIQVSRAAADMVRQHPACREDTQIRILGETITVEGDEDLLHRVVTNLVLNAVQAGDGRVRVSVEVREARPDELPRGVSLQRPVLLRVADDGPGIPAELKDRLFDPFVTGRAGGSGLGLAVVQRAVQAHRGYVFVESIMGQGTTFTIFLPAKGSREAAA